MDDHHTVVAVDDHHTAVVLDVHDVAVAGVYAVDVVVDVAPDLLADSEIHQ